MTTIVRPKVPPLWHRLDFMHTPAATGEPESYIGYVKVKGHLIKLAIDINLNGTTATWFYDPPRKLKDDICINERNSMKGSQKWWGIHYDKNCPATFEEAFSSFCYHAENLL